MSKPQILDLFCKAGGATRGYQNAGFYVVGLDIEPQPHYVGDEFIQADALTFPLDGFDVIHASPPCQAFTTARVIHDREHLDLLTPIRERLKQCSAPWVIENVPGAPMRPDVVLCGSVFGVPRLKRHRWFEFDQPPPLSLLPPCTHSKQIISIFGHGGHVYHGVAEWREVMGIDWMTRDEISQAIPPAYTEWIGRQLLAHLATVAA